MNNLVQPLISKSKCFLCVCCNTRHSRFLESNALAVSSSHEFKVLKKVFYKENFTLSSYKDRVPGNNISKCIL